MSVIANLVLSLGVAMAAPCGPAHEATVSLTGAKAKNTIVVEAIGPDCKAPMMLAKILDETGRPLFAKVASGKEMLNTEMFPGGDGTVKGAQAMWMDAGSGMSSADLPVWKQGAKAPANKTYGAFEVRVPREYYEIVRKSKLPVLIERGGAESGTIYVWNADTGTFVEIAEYAV